jgi:heme exporter protein A
MTVTNLSVSRGGRSVLEGLNFTLDAGDILTLRGPNGAGKTTLLRTLAGLQPPMRGSIEITPDLIAYAGHADGVKSTLTVAENLKFWAGIYGHSDISLALHTFDLTGLRERQAGNLSAGQKRRLGLARLVVAQRPVWVLDEPTVSLDRAALDLFACAVKTHVKAGGSAIIATHVDLGFESDILDVAPFKAKIEHRSSAFDEAFL